MDWIANSLFPLGLMISPTIGARGYPFAAGHVLFVSSQALLIFDPWLIDRRNACTTEAFVKGNCNSRCYISGACLSALACPPKYTMFHCSGCGMGHVFDSGLPLWNLPGSAWLVFFEIVSLVYKISSLHFMRLDFCAAASHTCSFFFFCLGEARYCCRWSFYFFAICIQWSYYLGKLFVAMLRNIIFAEDSKWMGC